MALLKIPDSIAKFPLINKFIAKAAKLPVSKDNYQIQLVQEYTDKNRKDNQDWRDALTAADDPVNPRWNPLQDLYDYVIVDSHTHSLIDLRKAATLGTRFMIVDANGVEQPEKTALLQTEWFYDFISEVLDARARGYTVAQLVNPVIMKFDYIPRRNIAIQKDFVRLSVTDDKGVSLSDPALANYIITVKEKYQYGYLNDLIPLIMWKLNTLMSWAEATEKWGIPPIIATTNKSDGKSIKLLQDMLKNAGESLTTILPEGSNVQVMQNSEKVDPQKMFDGLVERCNTEISKRIVGGTMISDNGSSHSQSQTHQDNFDKITESDKRKCEFVTNGQLIPMMTSFGYSFADGDKFVFDRSQKLSPKDIVDMLDKMLNHYEVDEVWIKQNTQIPITGKKQVAPTNFNQASIALAAALGAKGVMLPNYTNTTCNHKHSITASAINDTVLNDLADALINNIYNSEDTVVNAILKALETRKILTDGLFEGWGDKRMKLSYDAPDNRCLAAMEYNLMDFSLAKTKADVLALNQLLIDKDKNNIRSFNDFKALAKNHLKTTDKDYLRTEYNHSIAVGQNSRAYMQFMEDRKAGVTTYVQWQTIGDSHVRASHAALNGKIFNLEENLTIVPPKDWGCRCELIQYLGKPPKDLVYTNEQGLKALGIEKGSKWDINRAKEQQVFTANEMYLKNANLNNEQNQMTFKEYGLKAKSEMQNLPSITLDKTITKDNVSELFKPEKDSDYMGFTDYLGRRLQLSKKTFDDHTKGHYITNDELRHQLFPHIKDILKNPDEVYFYKYQGGKAYYQTNYIKHFEDRSVVITTDLGSDNVRLFTWFNVKQDESKIRRGYLIHQNKKP